jgi:hypothetical protein
MKTKLSKDAKQLEQLRLDSSRAVKRNSRPMALLEKYTGKLA